MPDKIRNVLFLCTGNSARSIMAEALMTALGKGRFRGHSAGSHPAGSVHPLALERVAAIGYPTTGLRSKSWDEFGASYAPPMDFVITVCDNAAGEICPYWPGRPLRAHWGFADPAAVTGSDEHKRAAFHTICEQIRARVALFVSMPLTLLDQDAIQRHLVAIGKTPV